MNQSQIEDLLQTFLHERDARCPDCSYSLRNSTSERCPGTRDDVRAWSCVADAQGGHLVGRSDGGDSVVCLIATLVAIPVFAGISDLVHQPERTQLVAAGLAPATDMPRMKTVVLVTLITLVAYALALLVLAGRKRFAALRVQQQIMLAGAAVIWPFAIFGLYALLIRHVL